MVVPPPGFTVAFSVAVVELMALAEPIDTDGTAGSVVNVSTLPNDVPNVFDPIAQ